MAVLFESSTHIELLLKDALDKAGLNYQEQYRFGTGGRFSEVKYVADFLLAYNGIRLVVECDGVAYHSGVEKEQRQIERDAWLSALGYQVLHFTTNDLKYQMAYVIARIKYELRLIDELPRRSRKKYPARQHIKTLKEEDCTVNLFCYYRQVPTGVCVAYKFRETNKQIWSNERVKLCLNVPDSMIETTALYLALCDLKRPVKILVRYSGYVYHNNYDVNKTFRKKITTLLDGENILHAHEIRLFYTHAGYDDSRRPSDAELVIHDLRSRCLQASHSAGQDAPIQTLDYSHLLTPQ